MNETPAIARRTNVMTSLPTPTRDVIAAQRGWRLLRAINLHLELTKARLSALVLFTTAVGFILASPAGIHWATFAWTLVGTALAAGCANALNQLAEVNRDQKMARTQKRPLVSGGLAIPYCWIAAVTIGYFGVSVLAIFANFAAAGLALLTILLYVLVYTPLKVRSTMNTFIGAVCGAIPPMIGWVAASGHVEIGAWLLAAILFIWQIPHFLSLAWKYREDYSRGGFMMLPAADPQGTITARVIVLTSILLIPLALMATMINLTGMTYAIGSLIAGVILIALAVGFARKRTELAARRVFLGTITYLPILMILMILDRGPV